MITRSELCLGGTPDVAPTRPALRSRSTNHESRALFWIELMRAQDLLDSVA
jgi:hypothetical protein